MNAHLRASDEYKMGRQGELVIRKWLTNQGYWVVPTGDIENGGAPLLIKKIKSTILPDILAGRQKPFWVEVKTKTRLPHYQRYKRDQHGIGRRLWEAYLEVQKETGLIGFLAILQLQPLKFYLGKFDEISVGLQTYDGPNMDEPMVYFDVRRFGWYNISQQWEITELLPDPIQPKIIRPWEQRKPLTDRQLPLI